MSLRPVLAAALGLSLAAAPLDAAVARSRTGSVLLFDDTDGKEKITLDQFSGGGVWRLDPVDFTTGDARQLGKPKYEDIKLELGFDTGATLGRWIESVIAGKPERKSGAIIAADYKLNTKARREFYEGLISEVQFPKCDAAGGDAAGIGVTVTPARVTFDPPAPIRNAEKPPAAGKTWLPSNFRFQIEGLGAMRVSKVDAFTIKQGFVEEKPSDARLEPAKVPGKIEYPNISIAVPDSDAGPLIAWANDVIEGGQAIAREGKLEYLDADGSVMATVVMHGLSPLSLVTSTITDPCPPRVVCVQETRVTMDTGKLDSILNLIR